MQAEEMTIDPLQFSPSTEVNLDFNFVEYFPNSKEDLAISEKLRILRSTYMQFYKDLLSARYDLGEEIIVFGCGGKISHIKRYKLRHLLYQHTMRFPASDLPEFILLHEHYGILNYFFPHSYQRYKVNPKAKEKNPELLPEEPQFLGIDHIRDEIFSPARVTPVIPHTATDIDGYSGELELPEIEAIVLAYSKSVRSDLGKKMLSELTNGINQINTWYDKKVEEAVTRHYYILTKSLENFLRVLKKQLTLLLDDSIFITTVYDKNKKEADRDGVYLKTGQLAVLIAPRKKFWFIRYTNFAMTRVATKQEFLKYIGNIESYLLDLLSKKQKEIIQYGKILENH